MGESIDHKILLKPQSTENIQIIMQADIII